MLDSVVKNVGTPYTVYLGRNLYSTFMEAYVLVDATTRRNMEAMLKTWKEKVPGSMDPRPVFPSDIVRPIDNALLKAKTAALQSNRSLHPQQQYRNTPTPPQQNGVFGAPPPQSQLHPYSEYAARQVRRVRPQLFPRLDAHVCRQLPNSQFAHSPLQQTPMQVQQQQQTVSMQQFTEVESLKRDIMALISGRQTQFGANPSDQGLQNQLKALLQLQLVVSSTNLNSDALSQVRASIERLAGAGPTPSHPTTQPDTLPQWHPPPPISQPQSLPPPAASYYHTTSSQPPKPPPMITPAALSGLQALLANGHKPSTPQMRAAAPALQGATHSQLNNLQMQTASQSTVNGAELIASLAKSGLLPNPLPPKPAPPPPVFAPNICVPPAQQSTAELLKSLQSILPPPPHAGAPSQTPGLPLNPGNPFIPITNAALKSFRPELVRSLYEAQPNQCGNCGRRFLATEQGRAKKDRHLDWHFRTNQRMADPATNRGQHRNWYISELDWVKLTDFDPSTTSAADAAAPAIQAAKQQQSPTEKWMRAPAGVTKSTCNVCFEEMKSSYSEEIQDWIFTNATVNGGKIVHAACLAEMVKGQQGALSLAAALGADATGQKQRSATPDSSLGKRKPETTLAGEGTRVKVG